MKIEGRIEVYDYGGGMLKWMKVQFGRMMALGLSRFIGCPFPRRPLQPQALFHALYCPRKFNRFFTAPSLAYHKRCRASISVVPSPSASMENPPEGYRRNVGICLMNPSSKKIFAASRLDTPDSWQMPQGGVDESEDPRNSGIRELREETGVISADIISEVPHWLTYDFPPEAREKLKHQWGSDWKGQAQKWFLFKFTGNEDEINLLGEGDAKAEFGEWAWISPEQVVDLAVDFKKPVYREVLSTFAPYFQ